MCCGRTNRASLCKVRHRNLRMTTSLCRCSTVCDIGTVIIVCVLHVISQWIKNGPSFSYNERVYERDVCITRVSLSHSPSVSVLSFSFSLFLSLDLSLSVLSLFCLSFISLLFSLSPSSFSLYPSLSYSFWHSLSLSACHALFCRCLSLPALSLIFYKILFFFIILLASLYSSAGKL